MKYSQCFWIYLSEFRKMCKISKMLSKVCWVSSHHQCYDSSLPFLHSGALWTSAEGIEIIKNRYSKVLTQKDFPQSLPLSGCTGPGRVKCPHTQITGPQSNAVTSSKCIVHFLVHFGVNGCFMICQWNMCTYWMKNVLAATTWAQITITHTERGAHRGSHPLISHKTQQLSQRLCLKHTD